jgi:molecular chaperone IbpA
MRDMYSTTLWRPDFDFDRMFGLLDESMDWTASESYPAYNVEQTGENSYQISLALAGFTLEEISITTEQGQLIVEGRKDEKSDRRYLHEGIAIRPFRQVFSLGDYVQVKGASFRDGLLMIDLVRELPEALKPRRIAIAAGNDNKMLEHQQAA